MGSKNYSVTEIKGSIVKVIEQALKSSSCHEKFVRLLEEVYNQCNFDDFLQVYMRTTLNTLTCNKRSTSNSLLINFLAKFVAHINKQAEKNKNEDEDDDATHPFLATMISGALKLHGTANEIRRCNACTFISQILDNLGDGNLDEHLCNKLQEAMLERLQDSNVVVRLRAVRALVRLQDVESRDCPVINAYVRAMNDPAEAVRKEVIHVVAPITKSVVQEIKQHTRDVHPSVRIEAFTKCGNFGHKIFTLRDRQYILSSGFVEDKENVKKCFYTYVLPTWLTAINKDYVELLKAVMMNGDDNDILLSKDLGEKLIKAFFKSEMVVDLLDAIKLDDHKVLVPDHWTYERIIYWNLVTSYLKQYDDLDEYLERVLPELTPLCKFIQEFIANQSKNFKTEQDYLNFQVCLYYLFDMASKYDLADEVGRRTLQTIVKDVLTNFKSYQINSWNSILLSEIVKIARKLSPDPVKFLEEICQLISDIREPLIDPEPNQVEVREKNFKVAELKVKINIAEGNLEDAVDNQEFDKAANMKVQLDQLRKQMEELITPPPSQTEQVRVSRDDPETICWCLDLLDVGIKLSGISETIKGKQNNPLPPALITCLEEFLKPLAKSDIESVSWRALKCILICCIFDRKLAAECVKVLCMQFIHYQAIPNFNKETIIAAIKGVCDFIMVYGVGIFEPNLSDDVNNTTSNSSVISKKKLYTSEDTEHTGSQALINNHLKIDHILEVIFDMLDDENDDVRTDSLTALAKLILSSSSDLVTSPQIMTRIILKYFNPLTEKASETMQQVLGSILNCYVRDKKDARITLEKATVPIINALANAPRSSPLSEINTDKVIELLAGLTNPSNKDVIDIHRSLAHTLCKEIADHPSENAVVYFAKMLTRLNIAPTNSPQNKELLTQAELLLEIEDLENSTRRHISNFMKKLSTGIEDNTVNQTTSTTNTTVVNGTNNSALRVLPTVIESDNETSRNDNDTSPNENNTFEPQSKKARRESDKENNVLQDSTVSEPQNKRLRRESDTIVHEASTNAQADQNRMERRGRPKKNNKERRDDSLECNTAPIISNPISYDSKIINQRTKNVTSKSSSSDSVISNSQNSIKNKNTELQIKLLQINTEISKDGANKNKNARRGSLSENKDRRNSSDSNVNQSSSSDNVVAEHDMTKNNDNNENTVTSKDSNTKKKGRRRGKAFKNRERSQSLRSSLTQSSSSDNVISEGPNLTKNKNTTKTRVNMKNQIAADLQIKSLQINSKTSKDINSNTNKKGRRKKPFKNRERSKSLSSSLTRSSSSNSVISRNTNTRKQIADSDNENADKTLTNETSEDKDIRKSKKATRRGRLSLTVNDIDSSSSDSVLLNAQDSTKNKEKSNKKVLQTVTAKVTRRSLLVSESSFSSNSLKVLTNSKNNTKHNTNPTTKSTNHKNLNGISGSNTDRLTRKNGLLSRNVSSYSESQENFKNKTNKKNGRSKVPKTMSEPARRNGLISKNTSSSDSSHNYETTKTKNTKSHTVQENSQTKNTGQNSNTRETRNNGAPQNNLKSVTYDKNSVNEQMRRSGRISMNNESKDNGMITEILSRSVQTKRKKSTGTSNSVEDSFDDTTILRTIVEPSEHHISLLRDDSPPPTPKEKTLGSRTLTIMSETSSESGSPMRKAKKSRKRK